MAQVPVVNNGHSLSFKLVYEKLLPKANVQTRVTKIELNC